MTTALADPETGHRAGSPTYRRALYALAAAGLSTFVLLYSTQALLPELVSDFAVTESHAALAVSLTTAGLAVALLVLGPISDRIGRTVLIRASVLAATVVALACPFVHTFAQLLVLRTAEGVALAGLPAVATAYLREELHPSAHARAAGIYIASTALGGMAARLITGGVAGAAGWRWGLAAAGGVSLLCAVVVLAVLPASRAFVPGAVDRGSVLATVRRSVTDPGLLALYGIGALAIGGLVAVFNTLGFRLAGPEFGLGVGAASLVFAVYLFGSASSMLAGRLAERFSRRAVVPVGSLVALVGVGLTASGSLVVVVVGASLITIGFFAVHGIASGWVPARAHAAGIATGQAASLYLFAYYVGSSVFGNLAASLWAGAGWGGVIVLTGVLFLLTAGLTLRLRFVPTLIAGPRPSR